jgi:hypothetical protein
MVQHGRHAILHGHRYENLKSYIALTVFMKWITFSNWECPYIGFEWKGAEHGIDQEKEAYRGHTGWVKANAWSIYLMHSTMCRITTPVFNHNFCILDCILLVAHSIRPRQLQCTSKCHSGCSAQCN